MRRRLVRKIQKERINAQPRMFPTYLHRYLCSHYRINWTSEQAESWGSRIRVELRRVHPVFDSSTIHVALRRHKEGDARVYTETVFPTRIS